MTARLLLLYGHPQDPSAFEDYYARRHIPYATEHMPEVVDVRNSRILQAADGGPAPFYRVSQLSYPDVEALRRGISSADGRSTIADLDNFATGGATLLVVEDDDTQN